MTKASRAEEIIHEETKTNESQKENRQVFLTTFQEEKKRRQASSQYHNCLD